MRHYPGDRVGPIPKERASVVLVSPQYKESANFQREALFASKRKKKMIPLLVQEDYSGDGWLELLIAPLMQYDITKDFDRMMHTMIDRELKDHHHHHQASAGAGGSSPRANNMGSAPSKQQLQQQRQQAKHEVVSVDKIAEFLKTRPGLDAAVSEAFRKEQVDGEALETLLAAWNSGQIRLNEIKECLCVRHPLDRVHVHLRHQSVGKFPGVECMSRQVRW